MASAKESLNIAIIRPDARYYRPEIDGLRALAVLMVVIYHAFPSVFPGGFVGVDVFFVISGYLITGIIYRDLENNRLSFAEFYARRFRRILPALLVILFSFWLLGLFLLRSDELVQLGKHIVAGATFTSNFRLLDEVGYFDIASELKPLLHLWSLAVEEQYYLVWPLAMWSLFRFGGTKTLKSGIGWMLAISFILNMVVVRHNPSWAFFMLPTRFWELGVGAWLALHRGKELSSRPASDQRASEILAVTGVALILVSGWIINSNHQFPGAWALFPTLGAAAFIYAGKTSRFARILFAAPAMVWIGLLSYPLYLWHWPMLTYLRLVWPDPSLTARALAVAASVILAALTYYFIERPAQRIFVGKKMLSICLRTGFAVLTVAILCGWITDKQKGFPSRSPELDIQGFAAFQDCHTETGLAGAYCEWTSPEPEVAVLGDSRAKNFFDAFAGNIPNVKVALIGTNSCPFALGFNVSVRPDCAEFNKKVLEKIRTMPSIKAVVLVSRGARYLDPESSMDRPGQLSIEEPWYLTAEEGGSASPEELFFLGFERSIAALIDMGMKVTFVSEWPEVGFDPRTCVRSRPWPPLAARSEEDCSLSRKAVEQRQKKYALGIARLLAKYPSVRGYNSLDAFCDQSHCPVIRTEPSGQKTLLFYDSSGHLTLKGGERLIQSFRTGWNF